MMEAVRTSETSVDKHFTRQYIPEDNSEQQGDTSLTWELDPSLTFPITLYFASFLPQAQSNQ
jgi:hypothetical protein